MSQRNVGGACRVFCIYGAVVVSKRQLLAGVCVDGLPVRAHRVPFQPRQPQREVGQRPHVVAVFVGVACGIVSAIHQLYDVAAVFHRIASAGNDNNLNAVPQAEKATQMTGKQYFEGCPFRTSLFIVRAHVYAQAYTRTSFHIIIKDISAARSPRLSQFIL